MSVYHTEVAICAHGRDDVILLHLLCLIDNRSGKMIMNRLKKEPIYLLRWSFQQFKSVSLLFRLFKVCWLREKINLGAFSLSLSIRRAPTVFAWDVFVWVRFMDYTCVLSWHAAPSQHSEVRSLAGRVNNERSEPIGEHSRLYAPTATRTTHAEEQVHSLWGLPAVHEGSCQKHWGKSDLFMWKFVLEAPRGFATSIPWCYFQPSC